MIPVILLSRRGITPGTRTSCNFGSITSRCYRKWARAQARRCNFKNKPDMYNHNSRRCSTVKSLQTTLLYSYHNTLFKNKIIQLGKGFRDGGPDMGTWCYRWQHGGCSEKIYANCPELESHVLQILIFNRTWNRHKIKINAALIPCCLVRLVACTPHNAIIFDCRLNKNICVNGIFPITTKMFT